MSATDCRFQLVCLPHLLTFAHAFRHICSYVGGKFTTLASGATVNNIFAWNGTTVRRVGNASVHGVDYTVRSLAVHDDGSGEKLFVGGDFANLGDGATSVNYIGAYDGAAWSTLPFQSGNGVK